MAGGEERMKVEIYSDPDVLADLAREAGMDGARARGYLVSDEGAGAVRAGIAHAQRLGISAVPTFVFEGRYAVQGAQPASTFLQALEAVARESGSAGAAGAADADCENGSCAA
jgi:predicted DsbA family dithiol-disulfide isomerase